MCLHLLFLLFDLSLIKYFLVNCILLGTDFPVELLPSDDLLIKNISNFGDFRSFFCLLFLQLLQVENLTVFLDFAPFVGGNFRGTVVNCGG